MGKTIFWISVVVAFFVWFLVQLGALKISSKKSIEIERALEQAFYMICLFMPISIVALLTHVCKFDAVLSALVWVIILLIVNKAYFLGMPKSISLNCRVALAYRAMLCSIVFYMADTTLEKQLRLLSVGVIIAIVIGFFVPISIILNDNRLKDKWREIRKETFSNELTKATKIIFWIICMLLVFLSIAERFFSVSNYGREIGGGVLLGTACYFPFLFWLKNKSFNALEDCCDARVDIFASDLFRNYRRKVETYLGYSENEKYDNVESFFFYKAFVEMCNRKNSYEADSTKAVCEYFKERNSSFRDADIVLRESTNPNKYVLKAEKQKYCGDVMTSPWPLIKEYIRLYGIIELENGNVPLCKRKEYKRAGFVKNKEMWLLYLLENYHSRTKKEKVEIIPEQVRKFLRNTYFCGAMWMVPVGCNASKMLDFKGESGKKEKYDFGDLALMSIWEWYNKRGTQPDEARWILSQLFGGKMEATERFETWLCKFPDWNNFVRENELTKMVKKGRGFRKKYQEPIMYFDGHSYQNMHPKTKELWLEMFDTMGQLMYDRR